MRVNVLGPLEAWVNGKSVVPTASKPRQVLSLLAIYAGELVTVQTLVEELWGMRTPRSAVQTVQTYILGLRRRIAKTARGSSAKDVLITRPCGYTLDIPADNVDLHRYQALASSGERTLAAGNYPTASRLIGSALDIWRGPALVDVQTGNRLDIEVTRLEQSKLSMLESRIEADLQLGNHRQLLGELAELNARYPMHEKLAAQYMTALYLSGMKWRALEVFRALRKTLVRELGIEPSIQVQRLQRDILSVDPEIDETTDWKLPAIG